jgi:succinoglycan biosynthesis transport protein ExoP
LSSLPSLQTHAGRSLPAWPERDSIALGYLSPGMSLAQILTILRAYWRVTAIVTLSLIFLVAGVLKLLPKTYTAVATLMVNYELNQGGKEFPIGAVGSYMATQVEFMGSDRVLLPVIETLHLAVDDELTAGFSGGDDAARRAWVLKNLRESLNITQGRGSQLLYVEAGAPEPRRAARIANAVAEAYLLEERRLVNEPASQRARDYSAELAELKAKVTAAQERVTQFRRRSGLSDIAGRNDSDAQALSSLEQQLLDVQNTQRVAEARGVGVRAVSGDVLTSPTIQVLKRELTTQEAQLAQLGTTYGSQHPKLLELKSQIAATRSALAREIGAYANNNSTQVLAGRQLEKSLGRAVNDQRARDLAVRQQQDEGAKFLLELESAQAVYKRALDGYDQIMFASGGKLTNVSLMSRAIPAVTATKPKKLKYLLAGAVAAAFAGLTGPLVYELWLRRRVRCRDDLERDFGIPVLVEFERSARQARLR